MPLEDYEVDTRTYDETFEPGGHVRGLYRELVARLADLSLKEVEQRRKLVELLLRNQGVTFTVYSDDAGIEKVFPFDPIPRLIDTEEWSKVEKGLVQRVRALNLFLADIYGSQRILDDGVIPAELV